MKSNANILVLKDELSFSKNDVNNINNFKKNIKEISSNFSYENFSFCLYGEFIQENNISYKAKYIKNTKTNEISYFCEYCNPSILSERKISCTHTNVLLDNFIKKEIEKADDFNIDFFVKKTNNMDLNFFYGLSFNNSSNLSILINNNDINKEILINLNEDDFIKKDSLNSTKLLKLKEFISEQNIDINFYIKNISIFKYISDDNNYYQKKIKYLDNDSPKIKFNASLNKYELSNWNNCDDSCIVQFEENTFMIMEFNDYVELVKFSKVVYDKIKPFLSYKCSSSKNIVKAFTFFIENNLEKYIENETRIPNIELFHESIFNNWKYKIEIYDNKFNNEEEFLCISIYFIINDKKYNVNFSDEDKWILSFDPTLYYDLEEIKNISSTKENLFFIKERENILELESLIKKMNRNKKIELFIDSKYVTSSSKKNINFNVTFKNSICKLEFNSNDLSNEEILDLLEKYKDNKNLVKLKNNKVINILNFDIKDLEKKLGDIGLSINDVIENNLYINNEMTLFLNSKLNNKEIGSYVEKFNNYKNKLKVSEDLMKILKKHQVEGVNWMIKMLENNFGCLLADDMGVGKTLQAISVLDTFHNNNKGKKSLIICPLSLVYNWKKEIELYSKNLKPIEIIGNKKEREKIINSKDNNVFIISYSSLTKDIDILKKENFLISILDESQFIKNNNSLNYKSVKLINSTYKIALTGTPIENNLLELWSIFNFITPGLLGSKKSFTKKFSESNKNSIILLKDVIKPFYIRREKKDVLDQLPDKKINIVSTKFTDIEKERYEEIRKETISFLLNNETNIRTLEKNAFMFKKLTEMRMYCCKGDGQKECSKLKLCLELIDEIISNDETNKILIFSQFTSVLEYVSFFLKKKNIKFEILTGSDKIDEREEKIKRYSNNHEIKVFLISLKAGGVGLNITAANNVIHYDPWWNIAVENQATDRSYRLGQKRDVNVYKLIVEDTIEEKIISLQNEKINLFNNVISEKNDNKLDIDLFKKIINFPTTK